MTIQGIYFDLDDTLYDQQKPFAKSFAQVFPNLSREISIDELYKKSRHYSDRLWNDYCRGLMSLEQLRFARMANALRDFGFSPTHEESVEFERQYAVELLRIELFEGAAEIFQFIRQCGMQMGILTNGPARHQFQKIQTLKLDLEVPRSLILISDEFGTAKPHPEIFHEAQNRMGLKPEQLLYVGDSWTNDIEPALGAGWKAIWANHRKRPAGSLLTPAAVVENLRSILPILKKLSR